MSDVQVLAQGNTPEDGVIRLERWPEGYVLWYHGEIVWKSFAAVGDINKRLLKLELAVSTLMPDKEMDR
jgi:hypothetical protein